MKVLVADKFEQSGLDALKASGCEVIFEPDASGDTLIAAIKKTQAPAFKAGSGFNDGTLTEVTKRLAALNRIKRPVKQKPDDDAQSVWLEPKLFCEVQYASMTKDGILREPVFLRLRPDLTPDA